MFGTKYKLFYISLNSNVSISDYSIPWPGNHFYQSAVNLLVERVTAI